MSLLYEATKRGCQQHNACGHKNSPELCPITMLLVAINGHRKNLWAYGKSDAETIMMITMMSVTAKNNLNK